MQANIKSEPQYSFTRTLTHRTNGITQRSNSNERSTRRQSTGKYNNPIQVETYKGSPIKVNSNLNSESLNIFYKTNE